MVGYDDALVGDLRGTVAGIATWPDVRATVTFGCPSFSVDDELFALVSNQGVSITKLSDAHREELAAAVPVAPFDADGRHVEGWATVPPNSCAPEVLRPFLRASYEAAMAVAESGE